MFYFVNIAVDLSVQYVNNERKKKIFQASALPRTLILLLLFLTAFIWISSILMLLLAVRLKWIYWDLSQSFSLRLAITVFTIVLLYSVGQVNVVRVLDIKIKHINSKTIFLKQFSDPLSSHVYRIILVRSTRHQVRTSIR